MFLRILFPFSYARRPIDVKFVPSASDLSNLLTPGAVIGPLKSAPRAHWSENF